jgi:CHAD domain-containing protein
VSGTAGGVVAAKVDVALAHDQRADAAAAAVLRRLLAVIVEDTEGSISGEDDEFLHQYRIAVRRSRTVQRQLAGVFPPLALPGFRSEFRWLQQATGDARDLDVYLHDLDELRDLLPPRFHDDLEPLRQVLEQRLVAARAAMEDALRSRRATDLLADWDRLLESLVELPLDDRPDAARTIGALAGARIRRVYGRIVSMGRAITPGSPAEDYHELRKKGKELRYLLELFGVKLFDPEVTAPFIRSLKAVQEVLGRHQDREIQADMLQSVVGEVAPLPGGARACLAMGVLIERLGVDKQAARAEFDEHFTDLAARPQRELVRNTFV